MSKCPHECLSWPTPALFPFRRFSYLYLNYLLEPIPPSTRVHFIFQYQYFSLCFAALVVSLVWEATNFFPNRKGNGKNFSSTHPKMAKIKKVRWEKGSHRAEKAHLRLLFAVWKRKIRGWEADIVARYGCSGVVEKERIIFLDREWKCLDFECRSAAFAFLMDLKAFRSF